MHPGRVALDIIEATSFGSISMRTLSAAILTAVSTPALAQTARDWPGPYFGGWGWGHMAFGGITMVLVWIGIILLIVFLVRGLGGLSSPRETHPPRQSALEVLQERYARGEINKEEYEERRRTLAAG
jgi:putative membrane protein